MHKGQLLIRPALITSPSNSYKHLDHIHDWREGGGAAAGWRAGPPEVRGRRTGAGARSAGSPNGVGT
jgi:hypothetical protein